MNRVVIIQARMSSTRFAGKVLQDLGGMPMIQFMVQRVRRAQRVDRVVVATSTESSDDALAAALARHGVECFRGSLADVLDRVYQAALGAKATHVVRLTGDCPLIDADLIDQPLAELEQGGCDYASNVEPPTHPDGMSAEAFTMEALARAWREAKLPSEREHVTPWLREGAAHGVRVRNVAGFHDLSTLRWTVDYPEDLEYVRKLVGAMQRAGKEQFDRFDLYRAIETQRLVNPSTHTRYEGYERSLAEDRQATGKGR